MCYNHCVPRKGLRTTNTTTNMKTQFVKYTDITGAASSILKSTRGMDIQSALFWAIHDFCGMVEFYTCADYEAYAEFTGAPKDTYAPDTFGLCVFDDREKFLDFWKYCDKYYAAL